LQRLSGIALGVQSGVEGLQAAKLGPSLAQFLAHQAPLLADRITFVSDIIAQHFDLARVAHDGVGEAPDGGR
jgi:hypothetical protein